MKTRRLEKSGVFILLKAFSMEKRQARSFNFLVPGVGLEEFSTPAWVITGYTTTVKTGVVNLKKYLNKKMSHGAI
jgi:hypothetical protein